MYMYVYMYVCVYICMCVCMCVCIYICIYVYLVFILDFRTDEGLNKRKRRKVENDEPLEELYQCNVEKIMKETGEKSVRMLLPIKAQNGYLKKCISQEDNNILNKERNEDTDEDKSQEENKEDNQQEENSDMVMDTRVRFKLYVPLFQKYVLYILIWSILSIENF